MPGRPGQVRALQAEPVESAEPRPERRPGPLGGRRRDALGGLEGGLGEDRQDDGRSDPPYGLAPPGRRPARSGTASWPSGATPRGGSGWGRSPAAWPAWIPARGGSRVIATTRGTRTASRTTRSTRCGWTQARPDVLWVGTHHGLNRFDAGTDRWTRFLRDPRDPASLCNDIVTAIQEDGTGPPLDRDAGRIEPAGQGHGPVRELSSAASRTPRARASTTISSTAFTRTAPGSSGSGRTAGSTGSTGPRANGGSSPRRTAWPARSSAASRRTRPAPSGSARTAGFRNSTRRRHVFKNYGLWRRPPGRGVQSRGVRPGRRRPDVLRRDQRLQRLRSRRRPKEPVRSARRLDGLLPEQRGGQAPRIRSPPSGP